MTLPDGPGSIGGVGENAQLDQNQGSLSLSVPFRVPQGFAGLTPSLGLTYNSAAGAGSVGIGWSMDVPSIERGTSFGLPSYGPDDAFVANEGSQLVRVEQTADRAVYRARFEGGFVRYTWRAVGDGKAGYWTAEQPDGLVSYYGADRDGKLVPAARVEGPDGGTFRYMLVETVDRFRHRLHYAYVKPDGHPLLDAVDYLHGQNGSARFSLRFAYEARPDVLSNAKPGFELSLTRRLSEARIYSGSEQIRSYQLRYEAEAAAGGMSRLASVTETGRGGAVYPIRPSFGYSRALGGACSGDCQKPFVVDMGTLEGGVDLKAGRATLIDMNGDSLPDMLDTSTGSHRIFLSQPSPDGRPRFGKPKASAKGTSAFVLGNPSVQSLDVNGDGLTDMISARTGQVLCNDGSGDWNGKGCLGSALVDFELEDDPSETGESDPLHVRFFDYDNDKRIDLLRTASAASTDVRRDTPKGFEALTVDPIGAVFDEGQLQLADMNGDGLQDPVELQSGGQLRYRLNLGRGKWSDWKSLSIAGFDEAAFLAAQLEDINGDGLDDLVAVTADTLQYALNRNAARFDKPVSIGPRDVEGSLPETTSTTSVLFADMNGNGSNDVVWVTSNGNVQFLDLFPVKPNLLSRIDNGIGMVQRIEYGTALAEQARDGKWSHGVRFGMNVVKRMDSFVTLTGKEDGSGLHEVKELAYHEGYYDGVEKQFRGFERVEEKTLADAQDSQEPSLSITRFDVGADDPYRNGLLLQSDVFALSGADQRPMRSTRTAFEDCALAGVPKSGLAQPVRWLCPTEQWEVKQEGAAESDWASVKTSLEHDGYGNVIRRSEHGLFNMGSPDKPAGCRPCEGGDDAACGDKCEGDETYTETELVQPGEATGDVWLLNLPRREVVYGTQGGPQRERLFYYDGPAFEGLEGGKATAGRLTRLMSRVRDQELIASVRNQLDAHGNVTVALDPLGAPDDMTGHRTRYEYDAQGLQVTATEQLTSDADGPYALRREYAYETQYNLVSEATQWLLVRGGEVQSSRDSLRYRYDEHGRLAKLFEPGDTVLPSREYAYELASPVSRIKTLLRANMEGQGDFESYQCLDGRGRPVQRLSKIEDDRYLADGFRELNSRGSSVRDFQAYEQTGADCAMSAPDEPFTRHRYDALGRPTGSQLPDGELHDGKASEQRVEYAPLAVREYDEEDNGSGPAQGTPLVKRYDGAGRLVAVERQLGGDQKPAITRLAYDSLDNLRGYTDALGHTRKQEFDLLGRVVSVDDPNAGTSQFEYGAAGNLLRRQDATGSVTRYAYDGLNRPLETWDDRDRDGTLVQRRYDVVPDCSDCSALAGQIGELRYPLKLRAATLRGVDRFGYDARRRPSYHARSVGEHVFETGYEYDSLDRIVKTVFPDGRELSRSYDGANRLTSIADVVERIEYDARGRRRAVAYDNGVSQRFDYDVRQQLSQLSLRDGSDKALFDLRFTRDRMGHLTRVQDSASGSARSLEAGYDALYRLTSAKLGLGSERPETLGLRYDANDNILARTSDLAGSLAQVGEIGYDAKHPNAVAKLGELSYGYDAAGSLTSRGRLTLRRDYRDRVTEARSGDETLGTFAYGADSQAIVKDEAGHVVYYVGPEFEVRDGIAVIHPRHGRERMARLENPAFAAKVLPDRDKSGNIDVADAWLAQRDKQPDPALVSQLLAASAHARLLGGKPTTVFLHADYSENIVAATSGKGELLAQRTFYPFGAERASSGYVDDYGWSGQERDESTGLVRYQYRDLDPLAGRFTRVDPAFERVDPQALLMQGEATAGYAFVANDPLNGVDPTGLSLKSMIHRAQMRSWKKESAPARKRLENARAEYAEATARVNEHTRSGDNYKRDVALADQRSAELGIESASKAKIFEKKPEPAGIRERVGRTMFPHIGEYESLDTGLGERRNTTHDDQPPAPALDQKTLQKQAGVKAMAGISLGLAILGGIAAGGWFGTQGDDDGSTPRTSPL